jgi:hypothetical protein
VAKAVLLILAGLAFLAPAVASAATSADEALRLFNAQRTANGFPAVTLDATWSSKCDKHIDYMKKHGLVHDEEDGSPDRTADGDDAGNNSVLASGSTWSGGNPWETAPIHLMQLLAPRMTFTGIADRDGFVCQTTFPGFADNGPATFSVSTYPGDGQTSWRTSEVASEGPFTPGDKLGLPQPIRTGPYLYVLLDGPGNMFALRSKAKLTSATLTGPTGAVALKTMDSTNSEIGPYMVPGAFVIPVDPLATGSKYTASATFDVAGTPVSKTWSFTTAGKGEDPTPTPTPTPTPGAKLTAKASLPSKVSGSSVSGSVTCSGPCKLTVTLTAKGFKKALVTKTYTSTKAGKVKIKLTLPKSVRKKVKKATIKVSAKSLAGAKAPKSTSKTVKFSR